MSDYQLSLPNSSLVNTCGEAKSLHATFGYLATTLFFSSSSFFFLQEVKKVGSVVGIDPVIIRGEDLYEQGFGGESRSFDR